MLSFITRQTGGRHPTPEWAWLSELIPESCRSERRGQEEFLLAALREVSDNEVGLCKICSQVSMGIFLQFHYCRGQLVLFHPLLSMPGGPPSSMQSCGQYGPGWLPDGQKGMLTD